MNAFIVLARGFCASCAHVSDSRRPRGFRLGRIGKRSTVGALLVLLLSLWFGACPAQGQAGSDDARRILEAAGTKGGLIVHLGCGDGRLTAALGRSDRFLVQGLDRDEEAVAEARRHVASQGLYGRTSIQHLRGNRLPYVDNLVNLIVVDDPLGIDPQEMMRVLAPMGTLVVRSGDQWQQRVKPWPAVIDEWTHFLHGADNNAVARDRVVGPPHHLQWLAEPIHLRSHEHLNGVSALVSARGRIFYVIDEGSRAAVTAPPKWRLVARDAFNGTLLWKRDLGPWEGHFRLFRSGPPGIARRLVAVADAVYATLGYGKQVAAFDAATGKTLRTYGPTEGALEILYDQGRLYVLVGRIDEAAWREASSRYYPTPEPRHKAIVVVDAETGRVLWRRGDRGTEEVMPTTMAAAGGRLFFQNTRQVICLDAASGEEQWRADRPVYTTRLSWSAPTLVVSDDVVLSADGSTGGLPEGVRRGEAAVEWIMSDTDIRKHPTGDVVAFSAATGKRLWTGDSLQGFCSPGDLFVIGGRVWSGANVSPAQQKLDVALNLQTGEVESRASDLPPAGGHTRCYRNKATERFLVLGGTGVEFVDVKDWRWTADPWVRGTCQYGVMPCNGLLYSPPDSCACLPNARIHGFTAMAPKRPSAGSQEPGAKERLHRGPAYGQPSASASALGAAPAGQWPTYRSDNARSGWTRSPVSARVRPAWTTKIGVQLTSLTVASGKVFVSQVDANTVHALDADSGEIAWSRTVGGPVDSPPTVSAGLAVFGSRDGCVYCLRAADGALVWRFLAAPEERFLVAQDRIESVWPVHGSVLVRDDLVWLTAGRSSYLDGGLRLYALGLQSGEPVVVEQLDGRDPAPWLTSKTGPDRTFRNRLPGTRPDILSASGDLIFMGWTCFDGQGKLADDLVPHLFSATGFLDDTWWHRTYWQYGTWMRGGFGGWPQAARRTPAGRLLVTSDEAVFGFGREQFDAGNPEAVHAGHIGVIKDTYQDSGRIDYSQNPYRLFSAAKPDPANKRKQAPVQYHWTAPVPMLGRAMLLAERTLWIAGPNAKEDNQGLADLGSVQPGRLWAVSSADGTALARYELAAAPILDGMAAIRGRLFMACVDGSVRSFAEP